MIIFWRGWGILIIPAVVAGAFVGGIAWTWLAAALGVDRGLVYEAMIAIFIGSLATLACYGVQRLLDSTDRGKVVIDKASGQELILRRGDSLFFIPVKWWTRIVAVLSVLLFVIAIKKAMMGS